MGEDPIRDDGRDARLTVAAAAERLGITKEAVRKRISRGTLRSDKDPDGTVRVYIPTSRTSSGTASESIGRDELVEILRAQLEDLRADRDAWRDQARRSDYMASAAMDRTRELESRIRELEAPSEPRELPETVEEEPERAEPRPGTEGAETVSAHRSVDDPPRLRWHVVGVIVSMLASTVGYFLSSLVPGYTPGTFLEYVYASLVILPLVVIPAFFGFRLGRKVRSRHFWQLLVAVGALIVLGNFLVYNGVQALQLLMLQAVFFFHNFFTAFFNVEASIVFSLTPGLVYISAAILGNAIQRRNRERLMEQRPAGLPPESAAAAQRWTPQQQAIVGLAGTILSALIGLIGTILTVMASG
jgi:hypothetical protein